MTPTIRRSPDRKHPVRSTLLTTLLGLCLLPIPAAAEAPQVQAVLHGGLVTWSGTGIEACEVRGRSWKPLDPARCIFPIDLLLKETSIVLKRTVNGTVESRTVPVGDYPYAVQHIQLKDNSKVNLTQADLDRVGRENAEIRALWPLETDSGTLVLPLAPPLHPLPAGGRFGAKRVINGQPKNPHSGVDYGAPQGAPVLAVADGTVALTGDHFFAGNSVFLDHGNGLISMYFHLHTIDVTDGAPIKRGAQLGTVGATGRATGPHLHYGLRWHGQRVDPALLFETPTALPTLP